MREDLQKAWDSAKKTDKTIYKNPPPEEIESSLESNERVVVVLKCLKQTNKLGGGEVCTAVLTDKRIHIFSRGIIKSVNNTHETIPFEMITGVEYSRKMLEGWAIIITRAANTDRLLKCEEDGSKLFVDELRKFIELSKSSGGATVIQNNAPDPLDQLKKLKELFDAGILSQEEYEEKRSTLMGKI